MNALTAMSRAEPGSAGAVKAVSVISTGTVRIRPEHPYGTRKPLYWWLLTSRRWTPPRPINVYVIEHAKGLILFDTGQDRASVTDTTYFPGAFTGYLYHRLARFDIGENDTFTAQLAALGYAPADVDTAIVSHLHQDHIGGLRELTGSELLVSAAEWAELAKPAPELRGYLHSHIQLPGLRWHRVSLEPTDDPALAPFTESLDVMGDGSLVLLPTPGHTAGSVSLLVRRGARPPLLLAGDLTYGAEILQRGQLPGVGNRRRLAESSRKVLALAGQQPGLVVLPAHDPTAAQRLLDSLGDDMEIDLREPVRLGESTQWIRIRAANARNPLLLLVQQGPGLPMINEVRTFERLLSLEDDFTVIYWDQRGCGRSLRSADATRDLSIQTMVSDTERLLAMLCDRFDTPAVVAGFSMGATIAALAAARRPDLVATLVAVSMDIDGAAAGKNAYEFALATAQARKNHRAVRQLKAIGPPPHLEPEGFATRARWAANFGGVRTGQTYNSMARGLLVSLLRSTDYSLADAARAIRGITATQAALLPELEALDLTDTLPRLNCPIVMVQGRHDQVAPASSAERYAELLKAPSKQFVWFEHSAHMPELDEPERFRELLAKVRLGLPANA